ncbi:myelin transcription factor 1-like protein [Panonychus citri]|uniref:myelin transcription factor 1-like protein n=1 Tax=Panonychus citri TaxID=50023 RepID=UPI0023070A5A|nr:myelin transcription factor 1-like protein [Panonychus citri]
MSFSSENIELELGDYKILIDEGDIVVIGMRHDDDENDERVKSDKGYESDQRVEMDQGGGDDERVESHQITENNRWEKYQDTEDDQGDEDDQGSQNSETLESDVNPEQLVVVNVDQDNESDQNDDMETENLKPENQSIYGSDQENEIIAVHSYEEKLYDFEMDLSDDKENHDKYDKYYRLKNPVLRSGLSKSQKLKNPLHKYLYKQNRKESTRNL